jgi:hypothetical protein
MELDAVNAFAPAVELDELRRVLVRDRRQPLQLAARYGSGFG